MPELPEVQTTVSNLKNKIVGLRIVDVWVDTPQLIKKPSWVEFKKQTKGAKIEKISRRGKNILIYLDSRFKIQDSRILLIHQKLTGRLLYGTWIMKHGAWTPIQKVPVEEKANQYIHLLFFLSNGKMLALSDLRKLAKVILGPAEEILNLKDIKKLGPEPLEKSFNVEKFIKTLRQAQDKRKIKEVLMDQEIIAGIGNVYSDEILWQAKIHPFKPARRLGSKELKDLYQALKDVLEKAVKLRGTDIRRVYQREGELCFRCGTKIKRIKIGGRSAHFCPKCQRI